MNTKIWQKDDNLIEAANLLAQGEVVAFPTETVYGLGADATNEAAIQKIYQAKGRPSDNPLIVHFADEEAIKPYVKNVKNYVYKLMEFFSPGPITYILESAGKVAPSVSAQLPTIGVRIPDHPLAQNLLKECGFPLAAPSANLSGKPSPTLAEHVINDLNGKVAGIIDGGPANKGLESTVIDCTGDFPIVLRPGAITKTDLSQCLKKSVQTNQKQVSRPSSPGMKYKHYAPEVPLYLFVEKREEEIKDVLASNSTERIGQLVIKNRRYLEQAKFYELGKNNDEMSRHLYSVLRKVSKKDIDLLFCVIEDKEDYEDALLDRLYRASTRVFEND